MPTEHPAADTHATRPVSFSGSGQVRVRLRRADDERPLTMHRCWSGAVSPAGGGQGIRTPEDGLGTALAVFKTASIGHSDSPPRCGIHCAVPALAHDGRSAACARMLLATGAADSSRSLWVVPRTHGNCGGRHQPNGPHDRPQTSEPDVSEPDASEPDVEVVSSATTRGRSWRDGQRSLSARI